MSPESNSRIITLHDLLDHDIQKFTSSEIQLKKSLSEWIAQTGSLPLKTVLQRYLDFVQLHVNNLEQACEQGKITSMNTSNRIMKAFIDDTNERLAECSDPEVKDACLLACIQIINHFKISTYGTAAAFAKALALDEMATIFHDAELNEKQIDQRLSRLAEHEINMRAKAPIVLPG
ncbi:MAG TPA: DUF892 family protein [Chitinophagaceae bacterium]